MLFALANAFLANVFCTNDVAPITLLIAGFIRWFSHGQAFYFEIEEVEDQKGRGDGVATFPSVFGCCENAKSRIIHIKMHTHSPMETYDFPSNSERRERERVARNWSEG